MTDFHTHILPNVDDGSKSLDESLLMLKELEGQGIKRIIATSHFYADYESVDRFLERRTAALSKLKESAGEKTEILAGAEVRYYNGISRLEQLKKLCIESSRFLLLEMPFSAWTEYQIKEIEDIAGRGICVVLAHIERYLSFQKKGVTERLLEGGTLFQANASFFTGHLTRRKAINMLKNNKIHFIGSDCHNMADRAPKIGSALSVIQKKCGDGFLEDYKNYGNELFLINKTN